MSSPSDGGKIASPCVNVCVIENGLCAGCMRTVAEIKAWKNSSGSEKRAVLARVEKRKKERENGV